MNKNFFFYQSELQMEKELCRTSEPQRSLSFFLAPAFHELKSSLSLLYQVKHAQFPHQSLHYHDGDLFSKSTMWIFSKSTFSLFPTKLYLTMSQKTSSEMIESRPRGAQSCTVGDSHTGALNSQKHFMRSKSQSHYKQEKKKLTPHLAMSKKYLSSIIQTFTLSTLCGALCLIGGRHKSKIKSWPYRVCWPSMWQ